MGKIFDIMPGLKMPIKQVSQSLSSIWQGEFSSSQEGEAMMYHACQTNLVLHFGSVTQPKEALNCFWTAVRYAQTYPSRIIVLCPDNPNEQDTNIKAKLFAQCYLGQELRNRCCCEALVLGYSGHHSELLEDQISVWIESDLPTTYWVHRLNPQCIIDNYLEFAQKCHNVIFDSAIEPASFHAIPWIQGTQTRDLVHTKTLPLRQTLGQFLSAFDPTNLADDLAQVEVSSLKDSSAYGECLLAWQQKCLSSCVPTDSSQGKATFTLSIIEEPQNFTIKGIWKYTNDKSLEWSYDDGEGELLIKAQLDEDLIESTFSIDQPLDEKILDQTLV